MAGEPENIAEFSNTEIRRFIHQLQVHQIELEMQNQELRRTQLDLEESAKKYADLYDFAPIGYFTLNEKGIVVAVNLAASSLLGVNRQNLIGHPFPRYIAKEYNVLFYYFRKRILGANRQTCEIKMLSDGEKMRKIIESVPRKSMEALQSYHWPGNVRELKNVIERAMILASSPALQVELPGVPGSKIPQRTSLQDMERNHVIKVLETTNWRVRGKNGAAEILGLKPSTLEWRMLKLGIRRNK